MSWVRRENRLGKDQVWIQFWIKWIGYQHRAQEPMEPNSMMVEPKTYNENIVLYYI